MASNLKKWQGGRKEKEEQGQKERAVNETRKYYRGSVQKKMWRSDKEQKECDGQETQEVATMNHDSLTLVLEHQNPFL